MQIALGYVLSEVTPPLAKIVKFHQNCEIVKEAEIFQARPSENADLLGWKNWAHLQEAWQTWASEIFPRKIF